MNDAHACAHPWPHPGCEAGGSWLKGTFLCCVRLLREGPAACVPVAMDQVAVRRASTERAPPCVCCVTLSLGLWLQRCAPVVREGAHADPTLLRALRYATIYTMFPVFSLVLDQDVKPDMAMLYPELYKDLTKVRARAGPPAPRRQRALCENSPRAGGCRS